MNKQEDSKVMTVNAAPAQVVIRPIDTVAKFVQFDANDRVTLKAGSELNVYEIASMAGKYANDAASATVRAVETLNIAKMLPKVTVPKADGKGTFEREAFDVACEETAKLCKSVSAWQNVRGMFQACQVAKELENKGHKVNPFKVKNALGYMNALEMLDDKGALKAGKLDDAGVKLLLDPAIGNNKLVEKLDEVKRTHNAQAKATGAVIPFPKLQERTPKTTTPAPAVTADSGEAIDREILSLIGRVNKLFNDASADKTAEVRTAIRKVCEKNARDLARLLGIVK